MNKKQAAEILGVSERAVERYTSQGKLSVRYEKGKRGDTAVYNESELKKLKAELDKKRGVVRPALLMSDNSDDEPRQLAQLSDIRGNADMLAFLSQFGSSLQHRQTTDLSPVELAAKYLLKLDEAVTLSGLSRDHLRAALKTRKLKGKIIGRGWKIKPQDLRTYTDKL